VVVDPKRLCLQLPDEKKKFFINQAHHVTFRPYLSSRIAVALDLTYYRHHGHAIAARLQWHHLHHLRRLSVRPVPSTPLLAGKAD
jgi:hypothetical protein